MCVSHCFAPISHHGHGFKAMLQPGLWPRHIHNDAPVLVGDAGTKPCPGDDRMTCVVPKDICIQHMYYCTLYYSLYFLLYYQDLLILLVLRCQNCQIEFPLPGLVTSPGALTPWQSLLDCATWGHYDWNFIKLWNMRFQSNKIGRLKIENWEG